MRPTPRHPDDEQLIDHFIHHTVQVDGLTEATVIGRRSNLRRFLFWCRQHELAPQDLSLAEIRGFLGDELARGTAPSTVAGMQSRIRLFYAHHWPDHPNPARSLPLLQPGEPVVHLPYRPQEAAGILELLRRGHGIGCRFDLAVVETLAATGIHRSELVALRTADLDLDAGSLTVRERPAGARSVPLAAATAARLAEYLLEVRPSCPASDRLFANPRSSFDSAGHGRLEPWGARAIVRRAGARSGVTGPHTCRRWRSTATVELLRAGVGVEEVQRRLGHADPAITARYLRFLDDGPAAETGAVG